MHCVLVIVVTQATVIYSMCMHKPECHRLKDEHIRIYMICLMFMHEPEDNRLEGEHR